MVSFRKGYRDEALLKKYRASTYFPDGRPKLPIEAVKISEDFGRTWKNRALCGPCIQKNEPPTMLTRHGLAGARGCDWCGVRNENNS